MPNFRVQELEKANSDSPDDKKKGRPKGSCKGRQSVRQKEKELNDGKEIPVENIDWEKITPEDRELMREKFEKKELELMENIQQLYHSSANHPLGRDRTLRRYWIFNSVPGVFVEDQEEHIPKDFLRPVEQKVQYCPQVKTNAVSPVKSEEKSTSSDKENDSSFERGQTNNSEQKVKILQDNNEPVNGESSKEASNMETDDEKPFEQVYLTVHEQIENKDKVTWAFYSTPLEIDSLINNLNPRGFREGPLKQALVEQKKKIVENLEQCPIDVLDVSENSTDETEVRFQEIKSRKRKVQGQVKGGSAAELMELNLREAFLDFEERVFVGGLGTLKVGAFKIYFNI